VEQARNMKIVITEVTSCGSGKRLALPVRSFLFTSARIPRLFFMLPAIRSWGLFLPNVQKDRTEDKSLTTEI